MSVSTQQDSLILEFPQEKHKAMYEEMYDEWYKNPDGTKNPGRLFDYDDRDYSRFLEIAKQDEVGREGLVPATIYFLVDNSNGKILGGIQVRHHINHPNLTNRGGHIGYGIRPSERGKGYGTKMLEFALLEAKKLGLEKILITCRADNISSKRVIEKNSGVFESEAFDEAKGEQFKRYWIEIT